VAFIIIDRLAKLENTLFGSGSGFVCNLEKVIHRRVLLFESSPVHITHPNITNTLLYIV